MNVLVKEQMKLFEPNISEEEYNIRFDNFIKIYFQQREKYEKGFLNRLSLKQRQNMHETLLRIYKLVNRLSGLSYEITNDQRTATSQPVIFAVTHIGNFDIQILTEAVKTHCYILTSGFECLQGTLRAIVLALNGVIYFNAKVKTDRKAVTEKMITHLKSGGNIMFFPEAAWNLSPNLLVMPYYWGIIDVARKGGALIVPIACEQFGKHFKINIGKSFDVSNYPNTDDGKLAAITDLRDNMATLKYEILETQNIVSRNNLSQKCWEQFLLDRFNEWAPISKNTIAKFEKIKEKQITNETFLKYNIDYTMRLYNNKKATIKYNNIIAK